MGKRLIFNAFVQYTVSHIVHGLWRHPDARQRDFNDVGRWLDLVDLLERGRFDGIFFADALGVHSNFRGSTVTPVKEGIGFPNNDASVLISALACRTEHLGLSFTSSVLQSHPFEFARRISTLDHISKGRIGWNIVTNFQESAFRNFGFESLMDHDERYRWGEEYAEVVYKLWEGSWEDEALQLNPATSVVTDPQRVHAIDHIGKYYRVAGPHLVSPSPQRTPLLFQAGSSAAGRAFAARNAEAVFLIAPSPAAAAMVIKDIRARAVAAGRRAEDVLFLQGLTFVVGATTEEARRRDVELDTYLSVEGQLAHASGVLGIDLGQYPPDTPLVDFVERVQGLRGVVQTLIDAAPAGSIPTLSDYAKVTSRATRVTGTPEQIVDSLQPWVDAGVDGFNVMNILLPGSYLDFIEQVVPVLQKRGLMQREYLPGTLREKLFEGRGPYLPDSHPARAFHRTRSHH